jgi:hypothetical protein
VDGVGGGVSTAEAAALYRVGREVQQCFDLVGGHDPDLSSSKNSKIAV